MRTRGAGMLLVLATLAACGSGDDVTGATPPVIGDGAATSVPEETVLPTTVLPTTVLPTTVLPTTVTEAPSPESFIERGPYAVGVITIQLSDRPVEVWYPVDPGAVAGEPTEIFDALTVFPEALQSLIPPELSGKFDTGAVRDAPVSDAGPFPVVVYSHGFGGYRQVATAYTGHLASWGFVVASADHLERGIAAQAAGQLVNIPGQDVADVEATLAALGDGPLAESVDLDHVGVTGHSAGAGTAVRAAAQLEAVDAFVSISGGAPVVVTGDDIGTTAARLVGPSGAHTIEVASVDAETASIAVDGGEPNAVPLTDLTVDTDDGSVTLVVPSDGQLRPGTVTVERAVPAKPALVVYAERDAVVVPEASTALYDALAAPRWLVGIEAAGHNSFTDSCAGIRELGGLQSLLPLLGEAQVARAEDGCTADFVDPAPVIDVLGHYSVAFFRTTLGVADDSAALADDVTTAIGGINLMDHRTDA